MAKEGLNLVNLDSLDQADPASVFLALQQLRNDFDQHDHSGTNSRQLSDIIAQTIQVKSAIIGGYQLFQATVGPTQANYKTVAEALNAGKTRIFVRNGTYNSEPKWVVSNPNTIIVGESLGGVVINFAQEAVNQRSIYINAANFYCSNMNLSAYDATSQDLFNFSASGSFPVVENCILKNKRGRVFNGASLTLLFGTFRNLYINMTATNDVTLMKAFYSISNSQVENVFMDLTGLAASGCNFVDTCGNTFFRGCKMRTDQSGNIPVINNSLTSFFIGCHFYFQELSPNSNFHGCFFETNTQAVSGAFLDVTIANVVIENCRLNVNVADLALRCQSAGLVFQNNFINGGKQLLFNPGAAIVGCMISNNLWTSAYTVAAMDLNLGANTNNYNILGNIIRNNSNSFLPTITNAGTANNVTSNQLIKG